jgi:hypothetical protein
VILGIQKLIFLFWDLFQIKFQKLISPAYNACFGCRLHQCSCGEGGYHFKMFFPKLAKAHFPTFFLVVWCEGHKEVWGAQEGTDHKSNT